MRVLWFGLGLFGRPMAEAVLDAGHTLLLSPGRRAAAQVDELLSRGAEPYGEGDPVDVCGLCLPTPDDVSSVVFGLSPA